MKPEFEAFFKALLGAENAHFDPIHRRAYSYDATRQHLAPDGVLFPRHEEDLVEILKFANENELIIIPRGAGSGFTGGALAVAGGLVLGFEKHMNKILEIDLENLVAVVQPGVINAQLQRALAPHGLFYPPDPASMDYSSLGGNVSENAGGMRAAKYGITKDYVLALRAVLPGGELIRAGKRTIKDVAGYNLAGILIASEGSLAVLSELTLRVLAQPKFKKTALGIFETVEEAMRAVFTSLAAGVSPVSMEFLDQLSMRAVEEKFKRGLPVDAGAVLIADVDGMVPEAIEADLAGLEKYFLAAGAREFRVAADEAEAADIWFARRNCSQCINIYGSLKLNEDITVPRSRLAELLAGIGRIAGEFGVLIPCFGHTGDGNVHTNIMVDGSDPEAVKRGHAAVEEVFKLTISLGGTLSGEHGIGLSKAPFMRLAFSEGELGLMRRIKAAFDPKNILNPYKMGL